MTMLGLTAFFAISEVSSPQYQSILDPVTRKAQFAPDLSAYDHFAPASYWNSGPASEERPA